VPRAVKNTLLVFAWSFVLIIAGYDLYFAWQHRAFFHIWELNPLARWIAQDYGLTVVFAVKIVLLVFGVAVAAYCHLRRHYLELPYTLIVSGIHLLLSLHYIMGHVIPI
jgi:hypothetical protein